MLRAKLSEHTIIGIHTQVSRHNIYTYIHKFRETYEVNRHTAEQHVTCLCMLHDSFRSGDKNQPPYHRCGHIHIATCMDVCTHTHAYMQYIKT